MLQKPLKLRTISRIVDHCIASFHCIIYLRLGERFQVEFNTGQSVVKSVAIVITNPNLIELVVQDKWGSRKILNIGSVNIVNYHALKENRKHSC